jgi:hypothetical protein
MSNLRIVFDWLFMPAQIPLELPMTELRRRLRQLKANDNLATDILIKRLEEECQGMKRYF